MWLVFTSAVATNIVARILLALGISYVSYTGLSALLSYVLSFVSDSMSSVPYATLCIMGRMDIDLAINLIFAAFTARIAISSLRKMVAK